MVNISSLISEHRPNLSSYTDLYKHFHANPELSYLEHETAAKIIELLKELGTFEVFPDISTGLAAVFKNGTGKTVLLRADIDALPVQEKTGFEYASTKTMKNLDGVEKPVMHACGHDMHMTSLLAAAELLLDAKDSWSGTLILCFQPAEERGSGAKSMVEAGLYSKVPTPDIVLGGHVMPFRTGTIGTKRGMMASAADSFAVTLYGRGAHGSQPHRSVDPIVMAAHTIIRLQTIPSRETNPSDLSVMTVGAVHAGDVENIIPDTAELKLDTRTIDPTTRDRVISSMKRIIEAESQASNAPKPPTITRTREFPFLHNDEDATSALEKSFSAHFSDAYDLDAPRLGGSEDFGDLATAINKPSVFWAYGGTDPAIWDKAEKAGRLTEDIPINHSPYFAPAIMPTLQVAVDAYAVAALTWLITN
jgi:amidohydrolase